MADQTDVTDFSLILDLKQDMNSSIGLQPLHERLFAVTVFCVVSSFTL